jgi:hypothetical protein
MELYLSSPNTLSWHGAQLKRRDNFTLPLLLKRIDLSSTGGGREEEEE